MTIYIIFSAVVLILLLLVYVAYRESNNLISETALRSKVAVFPDQKHLAFENVIFKNQDGITLKGWFVPAEQESDKTIVFMHGWGMNKGMLLKTTAFLQKKYNLFYFDFRGTGESGDGKSSVGYIEVRDCSAALKTLMGTRADACKSIGLYGIDVGAACAIYEGSRNPLVKCVVAQGCYFSAEQIALRRKKEKKYFLSLPVLKMALYFAKQRSGVNAEAFSPAENIAKLEGKAVLIINGADDELTERRDGKKLFHLAKEPKELWIVANAGHTQVSEVSGEQYKNRLQAFFDKNL